MKTVVFHPEAQEEIRRAAAYYEEQRQYLGRELRLEVQAAVLRLQQNPRSYPVFDRHGTRRLVLHRFPFSLYFLELEASLWIAAMAHHKRRPGYWIGRRPE